MSKVQSGFYHPWIFMVISSIINPMKSNKLIKQGNKTDETNIAVSRNTGEYSPPQQSWSSQVVIVTCNILIMKSHIGRFCIPKLEASIWIESLLTERIPHFGKLTREEKPARLTNTNWRRKLKDWGVKSSFLGMFLPIKAKADLGWCVTKVWWRSARQKQTTGNWWETLGNDLTVLCVEIHEDKDSIRRRNMWFLGFCCYINDTSGNFICVGIRITVLRCWWKDYISEYASRWNSLGVKLPGSN